jgi:hypothetical protein
VYVAFPFAVERPTFWLETAGAVYRAGIDQLPDTCLDWQSIQHACGVTDGARSVLWSTREAPLVQLGGIHTGQWARSLDAPTGILYAWLMNNLYFTNFRAEQGGAASFDFTLAARAGPIDADAIRRLGERVALPLATRIVRGGPGAPPPVLTLDSREVTAVLSRRPCAGAAADGSRRGAPTRSARAAIDSAATDGRSGCR